MSALDAIATAWIADLPTRGTPAAELTDANKMALCRAAGVDFELVGEDGSLRWQTLGVVGFADREDGGYIVAHRAA
jgi:hypothetical protein